jgi:hypothetical protein
MAEASNATSGKGLKIIGAGFGRTGTESLKAALEALGFGPCYHMSEVLQNMETMLPLWEAALDGTLADWSSIFAHYQATVDWPACNYYEELMAVYPDAKVLLSVRDPASWYESAFSTLYQAVRMGADEAQGAGDISAMDAQTAARMARFGKMITMLWQKTFGGRFEDREYALSVFTQHIEAVKRNVPAEKLLIFNVKEGWEPLCAFLGVPVPDTSFPHLNDRAAFMEQRLDLLRQEKEEPM